MDRNAGKNQEIKGKFVAREVYCNVNSLVEYIINKGFEESDAPFTIDDVENYYSFDTDIATESMHNDWSDKQEEFVSYANDPDTFNRRVKTASDMEVFIRSLD